MAGHRRLERDFRRFGVPDLAHEYHVRVLAQDRAEGVGESQPRLQVRLHLVDPLELVLDGIFHGDDVDLGRPAPADHRVERRRLARAGRTRHQDHPLRLAERALEDRRLRVGEPQRCEPGHGGRAEQPHDDLFAEVRGQRRDANVAPLTSVLHFDAAVLRQSPLGDVQSRQDLQPRDDRAVQPLGYLREVREHAVDAQAHLHVVQSRFDVDVARLALQRLLDDDVAHLDDGRELGAGGRFAACGGNLFQVRAQHPKPRGLGHVREKAVQPIVGCVVRFDPVGDLGARRHDPPRPQPGGELDVLERVVGERVGHRENQHLAFDLERQAEVLARELVGDGLDGLGLNGGAGDAHARDAHVAGECVSQRLLGNSFFPDDEIPQRDAALLRFSLRVPELLGGQKPRLSQKRVESDRHTPCRRLVAGRAPACRTLLTADRYRPRAEDITGDGSGSGEAAITSRSFRLRRDTASGWSRHRPAA